MITTMKLSHYLINRIIQNDVHHIFGVPGDYLLNFYKDMSLTKGLEVITTCDEQGAGFAADGYARLRGLGVIAVTYGAGALKLVNSTAQAFAERSPVLIISGAPTKKDVSLNRMVHHRVGSFDTEKKIFDNITVASAYLSESYPFQEIDRVIHTVKEKCGPGFLEIPMDLFDKEFELTGPPYATPSTELCKEVIDESLHEISNRISSSKQPVVMVGVDVHRLHLEKQVREWIEKNDFPFVTDLQSKSVIPESHRNFLGTYAAGLSNEEIARFVDSSDCVIKLGFWDTDFNSGKYTSKISCSKTIMVKRDNTVVGFHTYEHFGLVKFMEHTLPKSFGVANRIGRDKWPIAASPARVKPDISQKITMENFWACLHTTLHIKPSVVIPDTGCALFGASEMRLPEDCKFVSAPYYASMGFAVPAAIGVQCAEPALRPVVLVGDGSFQMTGVEVSTAVKHKLSPIVIVLNNHGYTTERIIEEGPFDDIVDWKYHKISELIGGGYSCRVESEEEFIQAMKRAYESSSYTLIELTFNKMDLPAPQQRQLKIERK